MKVRGERGEPRDILLILPGGVGDLIQLTPALRLLADAYPGAGVDLICRKSTVDVLRGHPRIRSVLAYAPDAGAGLRALLGRIRGRYDLLIDFSGALPFALFARLSGAPTRLGRAPVGTRLFFNRPADRPLFPAAPTEPLTQRFVRHLGDLIPAGRPPAPSLAVSDKRRAEGRRILEDRSIAARRVAIVTGAEDTSREWPAAYFVRLAAQVLMEGNMDTVFVGQAGKRARLDEIRQLSNSRVCILPQYDIRTLAGVLAACDAVVTPCNDIMHLAIALGVPTLAVFGSADPKVHFPYLELPHAAIVREDMACSPCGHEPCDDPQCLESLSPEKVYAHLRELLAVRKR